MWASDGWIYGMTVIWGARLFDPFPLHRAYRVQGRRFRGHRFAILHRTSLFSGLSIRFLSICSTAVFPRLNRLVGARKYGAVFHALRCFWCGEFFGIKPPVRALPVGTWNTAKARHLGDCCDVSSPKDREHFDRHSEASLKSHFKGWALWVVVNICSLSFHINFSVNKSARSIAK